MSHKPLTPLEPLVINGGALSEAPQWSGENSRWAQAAGSLILRAAGEDLAREGVERTPERFARALEELTSGYRLTPRQAVGEGLFPAEGKGLVSVRQVEFYSLCEHHMLPFWGTMSIAYFPGDQIVGLSKMGRLVEVFARRFQVQERLTRQVAESIQDLVGARAVACRAVASHMCMMMRGVRKSQSETVTETFLGVDSLSPTEQQRIGSAL